VKNLAKQAIQRLVGHKPAIAKTDPLPQKALLAESITGWLSRRECRRLYLTTVLTRGPILEIGHFLGRSSACICEAVRDVRRPRVYRSYDVGFRSGADLKEYYDRIHKAEPAEGAAEEPIDFSKDITTTQIARQNLRRVGLISQVELIAGNAFELDCDKYDLIFCDALSEQQEITVTVPNIAAHSNHGCVWALHGMNEANIELVMSLANVEFCELTGSLGIFVQLGQR
jgi:hypothetical protein